MLGSHSNKILYVPSWYPNKTENASGNFIKRLIEASSAFEDVAVLFSAPDPTLQNGYKVIINRDSRLLEVIVYYPKVDPGIFFAQLIKIIRRLKAYNKGLKEVYKSWGAPDLIHVQVAYPAVLYAWWLQLRKGVPYIVTEHGISLYTEKPSPFFGLVKRALQKAKRIVTVSNYLAEVMQHRGIKNAYSVIPNVVPLPDSLPEIKPPCEVKRILHISTLAEVKNVAGILRSIKQVSQHRQDFEMVIVGEQEVELEKAIRYAKTLGLGDDVIKFRTYISNAAELLELILSSNFMLMFSHSETFSVVLAESLWAGRPVITSRCGGPQEFITEAFGMLVEPGNEKELELAILKMLDTWNLYDMQAMKEYSRAHFAPTIIGEKMRSLHAPIMHHPTIE